MGKHASPGRPKASIWMKIGAGLILWAILGAAVWAVAYSSLMQREPPKRDVVVRVKKGMTTADISVLLAKKGVVSNAMGFRVYASINKADRGFQPGTYRFRTGTEYSKLVEKLVAGPPKKLFTLLVPEGFTMDQVATRLARHTGRPKEEFVVAMKGERLTEYTFRDLPLGATSLEGYLFPKTYVLDVKMTPRQIVARLLRQFENETAALNWQFAEEKGLSKKEIITIASLIEREAKVPEERTLVAAVIYNRLQKKMPLQIDATIQYALPERKDVLTNQDLEYPSPYNTYKNPGLPPGPIANPGLDSIKAALAPAQVDYLYYVLTSAEGRHTFTNNYAEFLKAKQSAGL